MKPWMQKSGIGLSGRIPVTTERNKSVAGNSAAEGPEMSTDSPIRTNAQGKPDADGQYVLSTDSPIPERISAESIVCRIVERAIRVSCARWSIIESLNPDADITEDDLVDDAIDVALGDDTGCLGDEEMNAEHIDLIFVQDALERERGTAESLIRDLARDLGTLRKELYDLHHRIDMLTGNKEQAMNIFGLAVTTLDRAVSRIPKELLPK